jgi:hypothetical protein
MLRELEQTMMKEAAAIIENALRALGSHTPIMMIEHDSAIRVGRAVDNLTIRYHHYRWNVHEHTPHMDCDRAYDTMAECARDIALCDDTALVFDGLEQTEHRINEAILAILYREC